MSVPRTLALPHVSTPFGVFGALRDVPRDLLAGRARSPVGETDAGKSALVKPLARALGPDAPLNGDSVVFNDPSDAGGARG